jgi:cathepsin L
MDCIDPKQYGCNGCNGGWPSEAIKYIRDNKGIDTETSYDYTQGYTGATKRGSCKYKTTSKAPPIVTGLNAIAVGDENSIQTAVATVGPVSVVIDATGFQYYGSGKHCLILYIQ